jgi:hypothetical protein
MPELHRLSKSKARIRMYADDHWPPHFHLWHHEWEALVDLRTMTVFRGSAPARPLQEAIRWVTANREFLEAKWKELNEREG